MADSNIQMAKAIAAAVLKNGGKTYFVGGYVRDLLLGKENKDIDLEVHGISFEKLQEILGDLGEPMVKGSSFGVMGLCHYDLDIAMPRKEKSTGRGHKDFAVFVDPFIGENKAAVRRDFTVNALMQDVLTGEILDFFGGRKDLEAKKIRHVDDDSFIEDPLRVFRAAQFAARFEFSVAKETIALAKTMDVTHLSKERVMSETEKALMKAERPSRYFEILKSMDHLSDWFSELEALIDCPQDPFFHPEGDVWNHTMQVLDEVAKLRSAARHQKALMFAALCHDLGKPPVTEEKNGRFHAYGHEEAGIAVAGKFLSRLTAEKELKRYVLNMVKLHMQPNIKVSVHAKEKSFMKLFDAALCPEDLILLAKADHLGRRDLNGKSVYSEESYAAIEEKLREMLNIYHCMMAKPYLTGEDLIAEGCQPGPVFKAALDYAHKLRLAGLNKEEQLRQTMGAMKVLTLSTLSVENEK